MRIFLNIKVNTYSRPYSRNNNNVPNYDHKSVVGNIVYTNSSVESEIAKRIKELTVDTSTLPKPMKIYFDTCCKYPRYKLKDNTDYRRVIKPANADIVVYTSIADKIG